MSWAHGELIQRALTLAAHYGRTSIVTALIDQLSLLVTVHPKEHQLRLINRVGGQSLRVMTKFGLRDVLDRFATLLDGEVLRGVTLAEARDTYARNPGLWDEWAAVLQAELHLAGAWLALGMQERAAPILEAVRHELLNPNAVKLQATDYTALARAYVSSLGQGPLDIGLTRITELFRTMDRKRINNTFSTGPYYSRFHLELVEEVVLALRGTGPEPPHRVKAAGGPEP